MQRWKLFPKNIGYCSPEDMNPTQSRIIQNNNAGKCRKRIFHGIILTFSTLIFIVCMGLAVHMTDKARIVVVLVIAACLLFLLDFVNSILGICCNKINCMVSKTKNSTRENRITGTSSQSSTTSTRTADLLGLPRVREQFRITPPPPYEIQMSEMSRMLLPGTSRSSDLSTQETQIYDEARKLIRKMYEEINMAEQQVSRSSRNEQSVQQVDPSLINQHSMHPLAQQFRPEGSVHQVMPKNEHSMQQSPKNKHSMKKLVQQPRNEGSVVNRKEPSLQSIPQSPRNKHSMKTLVQQPSNERSLSQVAYSARNGQFGKLVAYSARNDQAIPQMKYSAGQQVVYSSLKEHFAQQEVQTPEISTQLETTVPKVPIINRAVVGEEMGVNSHKFPSGDFRKSQATPQTRSSNSLPDQLDFQKLIVNSEGCTAGPLQSSPGSEDILKVARKRRLSNLKSKKIQKRPGIQGQRTFMGSDDTNTETIVYEEIDSIANSLSKNSNQAVYEPVEYYCLEGECDTSERALSACSAVSEPDMSSRQRKLQNPSVNVPRQLSALSSQKFCQLGQTPEALLDAIATCFELTPDEWMVVWKLGSKGVLPAERAKFIGVLLHENACNDN